MATASLDKVVARAGAKHPQERFQSAREFNEALQAVVRLRPQDESDTIIREHLSRSSNTTLRPQPRRLRPMLLTTVAVLVVAGGLGATWFVAESGWTPWTRTAAPPADLTVATQDTTIKPTDVNSPTLEAPLDRVPEPIPTLPPVATPAPMPEAPPPQYVPVPAAPKTSSPPQWRHR